MQPKSRFESRTKSDLDLYCRFCSSGDWREEKEEEEGKRVEKLLFYGSPNAKTCNALKNSLFIFLYFSLKSLTYLAVTIFGSFVLCWHEVECIMSDVS